MQIQHQTFTTTKQQTQTLKTLITQILQTNTAYDCMSFNNSVCSISKDSSIYDAINIIINEEIEELLVWDETLDKWVWMLTIADAIRLIMHSLKTIIKEGKVSKILRCSRSTGSRGCSSAKPNSSASKFMCYSKHRQQIYLMIQTFQKKKLTELLLQINNQPPRKSHFQSLDKVTHMKDDTQAPYQSSSSHQPLYSSHKPPLPPSTTRPYIRLKSVVKQSKLSYVIMAMLVEKIHRVLIEDVESKMIVSILSFKDILLYLVRIANESSTEFYSTVAISSLLDNHPPPKHVVIEESKPLWEAFELMTDVYHSRWISVVDRYGSFKGLLFREDFRDIFKGWHIDYLWMSAGEFIKLKEASNQSQVPEYRFFEPHQIIKEVIWKIVMTRSNTIVWVDQNDGRVKATIGLMELFGMFVVN